jgi:hypothetical protein
MFLTETCTGCWLLVAGCWLLVAGCWLLVAGCWLLVAGCSITSNEQPATRKHFDFVIKIIYCCRAFTSMAPRTRSFDLLQNKFSNRWMNADGFFHEAIRVNLCDPWLCFFLIPARPAYV